MRWIVGDTESGNGDTRRVHIMVKPTRTAIETNLVVNTDRRTYLMELRSREKPYMPSVAWFYPEDRGGQWWRRLLPLTPFIPGRISDATATPLRATTRLGGQSMRMTTAERSISKFARGIGQGEMPPLFVIGQDGKPELVNYRGYKNFLIVDRLFAAAELRLGGEKQQKVRIVRNDGRPS